MAGKPLLLERGEVLQTEGEADTIPHLLIDGWVASHVTLHDGARQMIKAHLPGDMMGLPSLAYKNAVDTLTALTPARVVPVPREAIGAMFAKQPRLAALLFVVSQEERGMLIDRMAVMGRADTARRVAALIVQLHERLRRNDPSVGLTFATPITQSHVADMIGATLVHVSRVLLQLRASNLVRWMRGSIAILDLEGLRRFAGLPQRELDRQPAWLPAA
ncbi:Crp/Fnr family transcriptional regulator [Sphingomonas jatrophae]|nr:Crp/Fnr family transcriptional regulator [Sphingomonas jatrophae]